jgi:predicted nucleotidyltransferase
MSARPSFLFAIHRETVRRVVAAHRVCNPRVFGSVARVEDTAASDLDLLVDTADGTSLFDLAAIELELEDLLKIPVHVTTDGALRGKVRERVLADAQPVRTGRFGGLTSSNSHFGWAAAIYPPPASWQAKACHPRISRARPNPRCGQCNDRFRRAGRANRCSEDRPDVQLSNSGDPRADNLLAIMKAIGEGTGIEITVRAVA